MGAGGLVPRMPRWLSGLLATVVLVAAVSGLLGLLAPHAPVLNLSVLYLLAVVPVAVVWGIRQAVVASLLSTMAFAFLFVPPRASLAVTDSRYVLVLLALLLTAVVVGELARDPPGRAVRGRAGPGAADPGPPLGDPRRSGACGRGPAP
jgi:K+-sensing histidine kinase KdpD